MYDYAYILGEFRTAAQDRGFCSKDSKALIIRNNTVVRRSSSFFVPNCCRVTASGNQMVRTMFLDAIRVQYGEEAAAALADTLVGRNRRKSTNLGAREVREAFATAQNHALTTVRAAAAKASAAAKNAKVDKEADILSKSTWPLYRTSLICSSDHDSEVHRWLESDLKFRSDFKTISEDETIYYTHQLIYNEIRRLQNDEEIEKTAAAAAYNVFSNRISHHAKNADPGQVKDDSTSLKANSDSGENS